MYIPSQNRGVLTQPVGRQEWVSGIASAIEPEIRIKSGQWDNYLPTKEYQKFKWGDTFSCVSFSALNCIETQVKFLIGKEENYSDRWLAKLSGTTKQGNYLAKVAQTLKDYGMVAENDWATPDDIADWDEYFIDIPQTIKDRGKEWFNRFSLQYEWIPSATSTIITALKYSPLQIAIPICPSYGVGISPSCGRVETDHAVTLYGYIEKECWKIFDHYDNVKRQLSWNYLIPNVFRYSVTLKNLLTPIKTMELKENCLIQTISPVNGFQWGIILGGKIMMGEEKRVMATWLMRSSDFMNKKFLDKKGIENAVFGRL